MLKFKDKVAATSGGLGDIVYSIPIMRELNVSTIYVKENWFLPPHHSLYSSIKTLLEYEGFVVLPTKGGYKESEYEPGLKFDYDLDSFRLMGGRGRVHIQTNLRKVFRLKEKPFKPWLSVKPKKILGMPDEYSIIHLTDRWRVGSRVDWKKILNEASKERLVAFLGFQHEWVEFASNYGNLLWIPTDDILDMAEIIAGAYNIYCNQSVALTLAQGLGKTYYLDRKPGKTNTLMYTKNENLL
jgi:hypothetical protein